MPAKRIREDEGQYYAGRWVARVRGKVIAQGATREAAYDAARVSRPKEKIEVILMSPIFDHPLLKAVQDVLPAEQPLYLVGGALRDALLGRVTHDLDFAAPSGALKLARRIANGLNGAFFPLDEGTDTARIILQRADPSTGLRRERSPVPAVHRPASGAGLAQADERSGRDMLDFAGFRGADLDADLRGRDFTINAMAIDVHTGESIDPLGGAQDLREKRIRACSETAFSDDPVRILRAVRQAAALGFSIQPETRKLMKAAVPLLKKVSPERQRDELFKILEGPRPDASMRALELLGVLPVLLPELPALKGVEQSPPHVYDVWAHTLAVLRHLDAILAVLAPQYDEAKANADLLNGLLVLHLGRYRQQIGEHLAASLNTDRSMRALLFFTALYHDVCKPPTKSVEEGGRIRFLGHDEQGALVAMKRGMALHLSNDELDRLKLVIFHHMRVHALTSRKLAGKSPSRKAIYRFFRDAGEAGVDLILLALADTRATYEQTLTQEHWVACLEVCRSLLEAWYEKAEEIVAPPQLLNGDDLMAELKMSPGRAVGQLLELVKEEQAAGGVSTREEALAFAREWLADERTHKQNSKPGGG
jgi:tRNA nucleotidyltransferase/poly(A) polymerase